MDNATPTLQDLISLYQQGQPDKALGACLNLLEKDDKNISLLNFAGVVYDSTQQKIKAAHYFRQALNLQPSNIQLINNLSGTLIELKKANEAENLLINAIEQPDADADTYYNLGNVYKIRRDDTKAQKFYQQAIAQNENHFRALKNLSTILYRQGDLDGAIDALEKVIKIDSQNTQAYETLSGIYFEKFHCTENLNHLRQTKRFLHQALEYHLELPYTNYLLGRIYLEQEKNIQLAEPFVFRANTLEPNNGDYRIQLAALEYAKGNLEKSEEIFMDLYKQDDHKNIVLDYLGKIQQEYGNYENAKYYYEKALKNEPMNTNLLSNLGYLLKQNNKITQSRDLFLKAAAIDKEKNPKKKSVATNNLAFVQLLLEDFEHGWDNHRFRTSIFEDGLKPCPDREKIDLNHKSILWLKEQGIGDELLFLRFIPALEKYHSQNSYFSSKKLLPLLSPLEFFHDLSDQTYQTKQFDHVFSIGDLPYIIGHHAALDTPPPLKLMPDKKHLDSITELLIQFGPPPYIGLTWRAGYFIKQKRLANYIKKIDLEILCKEIQDFPGSIVSLQKDVNPDELKLISQRLNRPVLDASHFHDDLPKMLALLDALDYYFTVSNTYVHMRESLAKPSDVFVVTPPEWRWLTQGDKSSWMPHSNIYRQSDDYSWSQAMEKFRAKLSSYIS